MTCLSISALLVATGVVIREGPVRYNAHRARTAVADGRYADAREPIQRWLRARPGASEAHFLDARVALADERPQDSLDALNTALTFGHPRFPIDRLRAVILARAGRHIEAEPILRQAYETESTPDPLILEALARVYLETYDLQRASAVLDHWAHAEPNDPRPYLWRIEIHQRTGANTPEFIRDYREALDRDPHLHQARLGLAEKLRQTHRNAEAATEYARYLAARPDDPVGHVGAGRNALEVGDEPAAHHHFSRALSINPEESVALKELAGIALRRGDHETALDFLDRAIAQTPLDLDIRYHRRLALTRLGRHEEAEAEHTESDRLKAAIDELNELQIRLVNSPKDRDLQGQIARWMLNHGLDREAERWARKILREDPNHPDACEIMADCHARRGDIGLANFYRLQAGLTPSAPSTVFTPKPHGGPNP